MYGLGHKASIHSRRLNSSQVSQGEWPKIELSYAQGQVIPRQSQTVGWCWEKRRVPIKRRYVVGRKAGTAGVTGLGLFEVG